MSFVDRSRNPDLIPGNSTLRTIPMQNEREEPYSRGFGQYREQSAGSIIFSPNPPQGVNIEELPRSGLGTLEAASRVQGSGDIPQIQLKPIRLPPQSSSSQIQDSETRETILNSRSILSAKLQWANQLLEAEQNVESAAALAILIRESALALHTVTSILK